MTDFLIKSSLSLCVLLMVYYVLLEKEKMHQFNRFYLLFSILFSFAIPFTTIEIIQEIPHQQSNQNTIAIEKTIPNITIEKEIITNYWLVATWSIYSLITSIIFLRFASNILKLQFRRKSNPVIHYNKAKLVLLKEKTLPYTFLNTIFINESDYQEKKIEAELFTHELIHVNQKHTLDILFIEILKVIFWFNPIFIFYKKAIQLNHEFLADEKVVKSHNNVPFYQNLLLSKANANKTYYLASNLNYSVTKKRLIMMTKTESSKQALIKKAIVLPILSGLVFLLCTKTVAQESIKKEESKTHVMGKSYYDKTTFKIKDKKGNVVAEKKYVELTPAEKKTVPTISARTKEKMDSIIKKGAPETVEVDLYDPKNIKIKKVDPNAIYSTAGLTEKPEFPGGMEIFYKFVGENYTRPKTPEEIKLAGKVYVTFIIEADGNLSDFKVLRDIGYGTGEEAIRVLKLSPKWNPGKINGEAVRTLYSLPIAIQPKI